MSVVQPIRAARGAPPAHLDGDEAELYRQIVRNYRLSDEVSLSILSEAMTSLRRARLAREQIEREGLTFTDKHGQPRLHPACAVERDSRAAALAALKQLNLELPRAKLPSSYRPTA